jgi:hypothetical protein
VTATRVDIEEIQTTRMEKLLAVVLAVFLLIGGLWIYHNLHQEATPPRATPAEQAAIDRAQNASERLYQVQSAERRARDRLELSREAYRTALEAKKPAAALARAYEAAQASFRQAQADVATAKRNVAAVAPTAQAADRRLAKEADRRDHAAARNTFLSRLAFVVVSLAAAFLLLGRLRNRGSRYLPVAFAAVGATTLLALVMAGDYTSDYIDVGESGPVFLSLAGIAMTLLSFVALQRYLAKRVPARRVRKHECPFCGYPVADKPHCEGCGRDVIAACARCEGPRRVGTVFCGLCGSRA